MGRRAERNSIVCGKFLAESRGEAFELATVERHGLRGADLAEVGRHDSPPVRQHLFAPKHERGRQRGQLAGTKDQGESLLSLIEPLG